MVRRYRSAENLLSSVNITFEVSSNQLGGIKEKNLEED